MQPQNRGRVGLRHPSVYTRSPDAYSYTVMPILAIYKVVDIHAAGGATNEIITLHDLHLIFLAIDRMHV